MKNLAKILLALLSLPMLFSCTGSAPLSSDSHAYSIPDFDKNQVWQLTAIRGRAVDSRGKTFTIQFNPEAGTVRGLMACNMYFGHYTCLPGDPQTGRCPVEISLEASGSLGCPEADMNADSRYFALLPKATHLTYTSTSLTFYQNNKEILRYELQ